TQRPVTPKRRVEGVPEAVKTRIPGLREGVPEAKEVAEGVEVGELPQRLPGPGIEGPHERVTEVEPVSHIDPPGESGDCGQGSCGTRGDRQGGRALDDPAFQRHCPYEDGDQDRARVLREK